MNVNGVNNINGFKSVEDIIDFLENYSTVYIEAKCEVEAFFIQKEFEKLGVRIGACLSENYPKHVGVSCENLSQGFYSSGRSGNIESRNILTFNEFKSIANGEGDVLLLSNANNQIQDKLKVVEHYLNGGDIQRFDTDVSEWLDVSDDFVLSVFKKYDIRVKPKTYKFEGARLTKGEILKLLGDE